MPDNELPGIGSNGDTRVQRLELIQGRAEGIGRQLFDRGWPFWTCFAECEDLIGFAIFSRILPSFTLATKQLGGHTVAFDPLEFPL